MTQTRPYKFIAVLISIACLCSVFVTSAAHAQQVATLADVSLSLIPLNPAPNQTVTVTAQSFGVDLNQATLTWTYGGKQVANGVGITKLSVTAPAAGGSALLSVTINAMGTQTANASVLLNPGSVDLLWEAADAYTPPFYKGKALLPIQGVFRVVAIPTASAPRSLVYAWSRNGSAVQSAAGLNKNTIVLDNTIFNTQETIASTAYGGAFQGNGSITITPVAPTVVGYQKKEGFIDYLHGSTSDIAITTTGTTLHFEPYFFSVPTGSIFDTLQVGLTVDSQPVAGDPAPNELRISKPTTNGTHVLGIDISTVAYSVQHIAKTFNLLFQ